MSEIAAEHGASTPLYSQSLRLLMLQQFSSFIRLRQVIKRVRLTEGHRQSVVLGDHSWCCVTVE